MAHFIRFIECSILLFTKLFVLNKIYIIQKKKKNYIEQKIIVLTELRNLFIKISNTKYFIRVAFNFQVYTYIVYTYKCTKSISVSILKLNINVYTRVLRPFEDFFFFIVPEGFAFCKEILMNSESML